ncbi:YciI family protein [Arthrobacter sp. FW306-05-C]|uniref:YciI family protein n=1 Tax=unclassified Arthrobacter TaxID=235627 RepID=UPI001EF0ED1F|nr:MULTISPECIES: YciI family protein [unclassified Arthrobacter]UKA66669.1 YciI family protein [Arthrobacter sp. FW306-05-C]UKA70988.1 YciI family protein [Arthrobacter sp. FW306-06-A]UKA75307.1 YciI family protein [Arthrobacter sp. FW306-07-I]
MYVVSLTYRVPQEIVDFHNDAHIAWLQKAFDDGVFIAAGRKIPRTGGLLLSQAERETLDASLAQDPFYTNGVADFEVMEFHAGRVASGYEILLDTPPAPTA